MNKTRLEAFSDGVIAIIITIMVLEMKVPHGTDWDALKPLWPVFLSYVLSFVNVGIYWNNHHHLMHAVRTIRATVPHMKSRDHASIVIVSSISGWKPGPRAQYGAAKAAEIFLASSLAWDLAADHIRVNTICPGSIYFATSGWADYERDDPEGYARFLKNELPEGRLGTDFEVAEVITFLCSERSRWINGAMVPVDGGQSRPSGRWFN